MGAPTSFHQPYADQHRETKGPGDARPTASQVLQDAGVIGKLGDKVMIITGCSAGIGIETAKALHSTGATLYLTVRNKAKGEAVIKDILSSSKGKGPLSLLMMDLSSLESVRSAAKDFLSKSKTLNVIVNNAGIMATPEGKTAEGFESQLGTNHYAHFLFFQLLKPALLASSTPAFQSRVVSVSSSGHRTAGILFDDMDFAKAGYNKWMAYGQSKTANVYMANSIERHYGAKGLHGLSLHPGVIYGTDLARNLSTEEVDQMSQMGLEKISKNVQQGAATQVWAAVSPDLEGKGGVYLADVGEAKPVEEGEIGGGPGYAPHAYDEEAEERLWKLSYEAVGLQYEE